MPLFRSDSWSCNRGYCRQKKKCPNQAAPFLSFLFWYYIPFFFLSDRTKMSILGCSTFCLDRLIFYLRAILMGFSSPARRDPPPQTHYYCTRGAATPLSRWWPRRQEMLALRVLPHRASCWGPQRAAAESLTLRSKSAKSPAYLPPGSLRWSSISFRTQVLTPLESLRECLCSSCVVQSKHCVEIRTHRPNQPKGNLVVKHLFHPVNNNISQSIAQHCYIL